MNIAHLLERHARLSPDRTVLFHGPEPHATAQAWAQRSARVAARLRQQGLLPGDRVVLFMRNHPRYLELMFGIWWAGMVAVPVNAKLHPKELEWIVDNAQASWLFHTRDVLPDASALGLPAMDAEGDACTAWLDEPIDTTPVAERASTDTAWLFYTSGTTGRPKGVMITHRNLMTMGLTYFNDVDPIA